MPDYPALGPNTTPAERIGFISDVQVKGVDMPFEQLASLSEIGKGIAAAQGTLNALPIVGGVLAPLAVATAGTMNITLGGGNEVVFCGGYVCDGALVQAFVVPAADPSDARVDLIAIQPATVPSGTTVDRNVLVDGVPVSTPISINQHGLNYRYVAGTPGGGTPATPAGFYAFATIAVAAGAAGVNPGDVTYLFPNLMQGSPGAAGHGSTVTTATFVIPAINSAVVAAVGDSAAFPVNAYCLISDGVHTIEGQITANGVGSITVKNLVVVAGGVGDMMATAAVVTFAGAQGATGDPGAPGAPGAPGTNGTNGTNATTVTTGVVVIPAIGANATVGFAANSMFPVGDACLISDGTHAFAGLIVSYSGLNATITCTAITLGVAGNTVATAATVVPSAPQIAGGKGSSAFAAASVTGSGSLALPALAGPATQTYIIRAQVFGSLASSNQSATLVGGGSGVSWTLGTDVGNNGVGPSFICALYGTAVGGQAPSITWTLSSGIGGQTGVAEILAIAQ